MGAALAPPVRLEIPVKLLPILEPKRFKVMYGGRGGGKSHTVAQVLLIMAMQRKLRILCVREVQKSLKQSSRQVLLDYIERLGLGQWFDSVEAEIRCTLTGSVISFSGLKDHNADSIKSFEGVDIVWVEEAHSVSDRSWNILIPTIRKAGSEIWVTFNPDEETDYAYKRWVDREDPRAWVVAINWRDNPWFGDEMNDERKALKALNDDLYNHVWEGHCRSVAGLLFKRSWFDNRRYDLGKQPESLRNYLASDYAGGPDPDDPDSEPDWTEHGNFGMDHVGDVWVTDWWSGQEDPEVWVQAWLALIRRHKPIVAFEEKGVILRVMSGGINRSMQEADVYTHRSGLASTGNKAARALGFAKLCAAGRVWIPRTEWGDRLVNQLCAFNGADGRTDDMVDACSKFAQGLDEVINASLPEKAKKPRTPEDRKPGVPAPMTDAYLRQLEKMDDGDKQKASEFYR